MLSPNRRGSGLFSSINRNSFGGLRYRSIVNIVNSAVPIVHYHHHQDSAIDSRCHQMHLGGNVSEVYGIDGFSQAPKSAPVTVKMSYFSDQFRIDPLAPKVSRLAVVRENESDSRSFTCLWFRRDGRGQDLCRC